MTYAVFAYLWWGHVPIYFRAVREAPALEVLAHRIVWAVPLLILLVAFRGQLRAGLEALRHRNTLLLLLASTVLIAVNWLVYIYAVATDRTLQGSLGYFINPLVSVLLGVFFLKERLRARQWAGVVVAAAGVIMLAAMTGEVPWIALTLAVSFGFYGLVRKVAGVNALVGLTVETTILFPLALAYMTVALWPGTPLELTFLNSSTKLDVLLALAGPITAIPLLAFAAAARRLPLFVVGLMQYISPSVQFLVAVLLFKEPFDSRRLAAFAVIWVALVLFSAPFERLRRRPIARPVARPVARPDPNAPTPGTPTPLGTVNPPAAGDTRR